MCPTCNSRRSKTTNTRKYEDRIWRRKSCKDCGRVYSTQEITFTEHRAYTEDIKEIQHEHEFLKEKLAVLSSLCQEK